jgi:hypothetical protein
VIFDGPSTHSARLFFWIVATPFVNSKNFQVVAPGTSTNRNKTRLNLFEMNKIDLFKNMKKERSYPGSNRGLWYLNCRTGNFKNHSDNHYTIEPVHVIWHLVNYYILETLNVYSVLMYVG